MRGFDFAGESGVVLDRCLANADGTDRSKRRYTMRCLRALKRVSFGAALGHEGVVVFRAVEHVVG